jgi:hypothetical protein
MLSKYLNNLPRTEMLINGGLGFLLTVWGYFSFHNWFSDSEFWPVTVSRELLHLNHQFQPVLFYKPIFHFSLLWLHFLPLDNIEHIQLARLLYTVVGVLIFLFIFKIAKPLIGSAKSFLLILFLLSSSLAFSNMGAIRSDLLSTLFVLLGLSFWPQVSNLKVKNQYFFWVFWLSLIFFTTPKSAYLCLILLLSYFFMVEKKIYITLIKSILVTGILFLGVICFFYQVKWETRLWLALVGAVQHGITSQMESDIGFSNHWLKSYLIHDLIFFLVGFSFTLMGLLTWFKRKNKILNYQKSFLCMSFLLFILMAFYKPKHLFFVASVLPIWSLSWIVVLQEIKMNVLILTVLLALVVVGFENRFKLYFYDNSPQIEALKNIDSVLKNENEYTLFDGIGLLPRVSKKLLYVGPYDEINREEVVIALFQENPKFILFTSRVLGVTQEFSSQLSQIYEPCENGFLALKGLCPKKKLNWKWQPWTLFGFNTFDRIENY